MRKISKQTLSLGLLFFCLFTFPVQSQSPKKGKSKLAKVPISMPHIINLREVKRMYQFSNSLCWAASIQMLLTYYEGIAEFSLDTIVKKKTNMTECITPKTCPDTSKCDNSMEQDDLSEVPIDAQRGYETILSRLGYYSNLETNKLEWYIVKKQIDNCHPFLLTISDGTTIGTGLEDSRHMVVVKGYWEKGVDKYLIINDPYGNCKGQIYSLNFNKLYDPIAVDKVFNYIINIRKKEDSYCFSCGNKRIMPGKTSDEENRINTFQNSKKSISQFMESLNNNVPLSTKIIKLYIVSERKLGVVNDPTNLESISENTDIIDVPLDKDIVIRLQRFRDNKYQIMRIMENFYQTLGEDLPDSYVVYPKTHQNYFVRVNKFMPQYNVKDAFENTKTYKFNEFAKSLKLELAVQQTVNIPQQRDWDRINIFFEKYRNHLDIEQIKNRIPSLRQVRNN